MLRNSTWLGKGDFMKSESAAGYWQTQPRKRSVFRKLLVAMLLLFGFWQFGQGFYIQAKAQVAQLLVAKAWRESLRTGQPTAPWHWADTWPVAKLNFPELNEYSYVLAGSTDAIIAFGPGHLVQSAFPGQSGNSVIVGHRDTHFALLQDLQKDQLIEVETQYGTTLYKVQSMRIAHESQVELLEATADTSLTLVTCYPFDSVSAGTEHRYIVTAVELEK